MFNVFLPKLLETRPGPTPIGEESPKALKESLWDVVIFTIGGCPGAIVSFLGSFRMFRTDFLVMALSSVLT
jgi:hypothetical protein